MKSKPSGAIRQTITLLEQEVASLEQRRGDLLRVIESLRPLAGETRLIRGRVSRVVVEVPTRKARGRSKTALKRNERTNERTNEQSAGQRDGAHGASLT